MKLQKIITVKYDEFYTLMQFACMKHEINVERIDYQKEFVDIDREEEVVTYSLFDAVKRFLVANVSDVFVSEVKQEVNIVC